MRSRHKILLEGLWQRSTTQAVPIVQFTVGGVVVPAGGLVSFPSFLTGAFSTVALIARNLSVVPLTITSMSFPAGFSPQGFGLPRTLQPGDYAQFTLVATSSLPGDLLGQLVIGAAGIGEVTFNLEALAVLAAHYEHSLLTSSLAAVSLIPTVVPAATQPEQGHTTATLADVNRHPTVIYGATQPEQAQLLAALAEVINHPTVIYGATQPEQAQGTVTLAEAKTTPTVVYGTPLRPLGVETMALDAVVRHSTVIISPLMPQQVHTSVALEALAMIPTVLYSIPGYLRSALETFLDSLALIPTSIQGVTQPEQAHDTVALASASHTQVIPAGLPVPVSDDADQTVSLASIVYA